MIDYSLIAESINFYNEKGYKKKQVPWIVPREIVEYTIPKDGKHFDIKNEGSLVGSAESSFIFMIKTKQIEKGTFQAVTPCFRGDEVDLIHRKYFLKNELIMVNKKDKLSLEKIIEDAYSFFSTIINKNRIIIQKEHDKRSIESYDILIKTREGEIEVGSYGIRNNDFGSWIYGTGCAEPRLSIVRKLIKEEL